MGLRLSIFVLIGLFAACTPTGQAPLAPTIVAVGPSDAPVVVEDDGHRIVDDMAAAERLYEEEHDPRAILAYFAPDVTVVAGRGKKPDATDNVMDYRTFSAVYIWAAKFDTKMKFHYEDAHLTVKGESAVMEWTSFHESTAPGVEGTWSFIQHYELHRRDHKWLIVKYRYWPLRPEDGQEYDFEALDAEVDAARASHDKRNLARNLMLAYRFKESAEMAREITQDDPTDAWNWDMRAKASAMVGDLADAEMASKKAARLKGSRDYDEP